LGKIRFPIETEIHAQKKFTASSRQAKLSSIATDIYDVFKTITGIVIFTQNSEYNSIERF